MLLCPRSNSKLHSAMLALRAGSSPLGNRLKSTAKVACNVDTGSRSQQRQGSVPVCGAASEMERCEALARIRLYSYRVDSFREVRQVIVQQQW
jgi:transcription elongation factor Elf1